MNNKPHPHADVLRAIADVLRAIADVLRAIADGVPLSEFEVTCNDLCWFNVKDAKMTDWFFRDPQQWLVRRRKQRTHVVNGFTVPAPMDKELSSGDNYFVPSLVEDTYVAKHCWADYSCELAWLQRGLLFETKEAAIANAKAMLKIDPSKE